MSVFDICLEAIKIYWKSGNNREIDLADVKNGLANFWVASPDLQRDPN